MTKTLFLTALLAGTVFATNVAAQANTKTVTMKDAKGVDVATVTLTEGADERVLIKLEGRNLPPGWHGFHIHEKGDCTAPDFTSAGGHFNPDKDEHGAMAHDDFHAGDLPNIYVHSDGTAQVELFSDDVSITDTDDDGYLLKKDGVAFMIHADADDYTSKDTGNAGARIACGALMN